MKELLKNQIQKEGNYKMFPQYLLALPPKESVMLMYLIDQEAYIEQRLADEPEYFRCNQENYIKNYFIGWSSNLISTAIDSLCKSGYIYKKIIRIEGKKNTFIKLNYDAIYELKSNYEKQLTENRSNNMVRFINSDDLEEEYENLTGRYKDFDTQTLKNCEPDIKNLIGRPKDFNNHTLKNCESELKVEHTPTPKIGVDNLKNWGRQHQKLRLTTSKFKVDNIKKLGRQPQKVGLYNNIYNNIYNNYDKNKDKIYDKNIFKTFSKSCEPDGSSNTNRGEVLNFSEFNSNINKPVKNLTNEGSTLENEKNTNVDKAADPAPKKDTVNSKGYKALMEYIDATTYSFETKEELKKWYNEVGKGKVSVNQLRDKLNDLYEQVGGDEVKTREAIHRSYINSYMAFYAVKSNNSFNRFGKVDTIHTSHKVAEPQKKVERIVI